MRRLAGLWSGLAFVGFLLVTSQASAQWGWGGYHASTAGEGYARGLADVIRSEANANLVNAQAQQVMVQTETLDMQNRAAWAQGYLQMRAQMKADEKARIAKARETEAMFRQGTNRLTRLTSVELDPVTGAINWPAILGTPRYKDNRDIIDALFTKRATEGPTYRIPFIEVFNPVTEMRTDLISRQGSIPSDQYKPSLDFLQRIVQEAKFSAQG